ncbi:pentapeptide repeat-containing protein [Ktedonobacter sp. SOSP1-85]|uniref:pentapeptide repeat-containing protein n=1 Tax=Ktedonobacter sp. SOSP1-85 TaxID=2778367 RepID=UPI001914DC6A|nr:pentapeptide repeat-containing protein [Ktedonobacter sp. SOSP1-85]
MIQKNAFWWAMQKKRIVTIIGAMICVGFVALSQYQTPKSLWEWMQLLIVPLVLAIGGFLLNRTASKTEQEKTEKRYQNDHKIAKDKQRADLLQTYLDHMSDLLLKENLRMSQPDSEVRNVARIRTITVLGQLDTPRVNHVLSFLREAKLVTAQQGESVVSFSGADMRGIDLKGGCAYEIDLSGANLSQADLSGANLSQAGLSQANLSQADLSRADLSGADLSRADLSEANLSEANLNEANLNRASLIEANFSFANFSFANFSFANFSFANLSEADLSRADLSRADLSRALRLSEANLSGVDLSEANPSETIVSQALNVTEEQFGKAKAH